MSSKDKLVKTKKLNTPLLFRLFNFNTSILFLKFKTFLIHKSLFLFLSFPIRKLSSKPVDH